MVDKNLLELITNGVSLKLELSGEDLLRFSQDLIKRAVSEIVAAKEETSDEKLLTRDEVKNLCGVCDATLWHWRRRRYLEAIKVGSRVRYRQSDVEKILGRSKGKHIGCLE